MICKNCGNQLDNNALFCNVCGAKQEPIQNQPQVFNPYQAPVQNQVPVQVPNSAPVQNQRPVQNQMPMQNPMQMPNPNGVATMTMPPKKKSKLPIILGGVGAGVFMLIGILVVIGVIVSSTRVNVDNYINFNNLEIKGSDGYGYIEYLSVVDVKGLYRDTGHEVYDYSVFDDDFSNVDEFLDDANSFYEIMDAFRFEANIDSGISNGDTVVVTVTVDYDKLNQYSDKKVVGDDVYTYTVEVNDLPDEYDFWGDYSDDDLFGDYDDYWY